MRNQGTTSNNNEITEEGAMASSSTTSGSNINYSYVDHVTIFVAYNGKWEYDGKEWLFKNSRSSKSSIMVLPKHITLSEMTDKLNKQFKVNTQLYRIKLEVHYRTGIPWFPVTEIQNNEDLSVFMSETSKEKLPLCVTRLNNAYEHVVGERWKDDTVEYRLMKAIQNYDWARARKIVNREEVTWTSKLDDEGNTAFHFAVGEFKDNEVFMDILMEIDTELLVTIVNNDGMNPVHTAALFGNTEALKIMSHFNPRCLFIPDDRDDLAINIALAMQKMETFQYLFNKMRKKLDLFLRGKSGLKLLGKAIDTGLIDVAYELIKDYPSMAAQEYDDITALERIIRKPYLFFSGMDFNLWQRFLYIHVITIENIDLGGTYTADEENQERPKKDKSVTKHTRRCLYDVISMIWVKLWEITLLHVPYVKDLKDDKVMHNTTIMLLRRICHEVDRTNTSSEIQRLYSAPFCLAVENNIPEAIDELTSYFPQLFGLKAGHNIYQLAVLNRSEDVYRFIVNHVRHAKSGFLKFVDDDGNNILHLAGRLSPIHKLASRPALQMQKELQWYLEVKRVVGITHTRRLNKNKETPMMVFRKEHKELRKDAEEWMKKTADSYTITATLIITIVFAAAITVPGGNDDKTGKPIYEMKPSFIIFAVADAISLFTATTSLLSFLYILTARYKDEDFLYHLPKRLIYGLVMLFLSVISMMIAFSATLYIVFGQEKQWIMIPIGALACLPIASFLTLQIPLLVELIASTYGHGIFAKEKDNRHSSANANKKKGALET